MRKLFLAIALVGLVGSSAYAQKKDTKPKVKSYDFSGDTIEGDLVRPDNTLIGAEDVANFSSLIRIRRDFIAEIIKAAEDL